MEKHNMYAQKLEEDEILDGIMRRQAQAQQRQQQQQLQQQQHQHHRQLQLQLQQKLTQQMEARASQELTANTALASNLQDFQQRREQFALQQQQQQRQQQQKLQQQQRETIRATVTVPPKIICSTEPFSATLKTLSRERGGDADNNDLTNLLSSSFPHTLFVALEEAKYPNALKWSNNGQGFYTNQGHPAMADALLHYFKQRKFISWYRQLNEHGWKKIYAGRNKGMMYHRNFHRLMGTEDFHAVIQHKKETALMQQNQKNKREQNEKLKSKKLKVTVSKAKKSLKTSIKATASSSTKTTTTTAKKSNNTKATTKVTVKKKAASGVGSPTLNKKKRGRSPYSLGTVETNQTKKKVALSTTDDKAEDRKSTKRLAEHKRLYNVFRKWDMWTFPKDLDMFLENGKVQYHGKKRKTTKPTHADVADAEPEGYDDNTEDKIAALLCDEEMPEWMIDTKDDKQALADFVDRIRQDKIQQDKLKEIWSKDVAHVVKGKVLAPSKFFKPTENWKKVKAGARIGVYWRDDAIFYNAIIQKQQGNTSYFHLMYDDDGAQEWLDLSRESFKILEGVAIKKPVTVVHSTPRRAVRHSSRALITDETPRKDNRARLAKDDNNHQSESSKTPINLPDSHSHLAPFVRYSWKELGLGSNAGTASYNSFVRERDELAPSVTALEILNDLRALRAKGFSGIPLQLDSENSGSDSDNGISSDPNQIVKSQLRYLQDKILKDNDTASSMKQFDQTLHAVRKLTDKWSIPAVRENLRTIETQVLKLNDREAKILEKCKQKGLFS